QLILSKQGAIATIVRGVLPIQVRAVFIVQQINVEFVYTYSQTGAPVPVVIQEDIVDTIVGDAFTGPDESFPDQVNFKCVRTCDKRQTNVSIAYLKVMPPDLSFRLFMGGVQEGA